MSAQQINILTQVNTLMVRRTIAINRITRAAIAGKYDTPEIAQLRTFARAAASRADFLMANLG